MESRSISRHLRSSRQHWVTACATALTELSSAASADLAIENVNVIPMTRSGDVMRDVTVIIRNDRIESIGPSARMSAPKNMGRLNARGKWLLPALADKQVHVENDRLLRLYTGDASIETGTVRTADALLPYVANGILQITVLSTMSETIAQRDDVESGRVLGRTWR